MNGRRDNSKWLAWIVLLGIFAMVPLFALLQFRHGTGSGGPATHVEGGAGWPRVLVERSPDGEQGRRIVLQAPPRRIVSVTLATDEILLDLVAPERIIALSSLATMRGSLIANRISDIPHFVGNDVESIIGLEPDLCFLASYNRKEVRSLLVDSGIPVYVFRCFDGLEDVRINLQTIGRAVGAESQAERLVEEMDRKLAYVAGRIPPRQQWPSALVYENGGWVAGAGTAQTEVMEAAGLRNAAAEYGLEGFTQVSEEQVLEMAPDFLIITTKSIAEEAEKQRLGNNPALAPLEAIRKKRFVFVQEALLSTVSHYIADGVVTIARQVYPDRFADEQS